MNTNLSPLRRIGATLAIAGFAALGSVALAPAASATPAAEDGAMTVIDGVGNGNGPAKFILLENGQRIPVFYCDADKPMKRHTICEPVPVVGGPRF